MSRLVDQVRQARREASGGKAEYLVLAAAECGAICAVTLLEASERRPCLIIVAGRSDTSLAWMAKQFLPADEFGGSFTPGRCFFYAVGRIEGVGVAAILPFLGDVKINGEGGWHPVGLAMTSSSTVSFELSAIPGTWRLWVDDPDWNEWQPETPLLVQTHAAFPLPILGDEAPIRFEISPHSGRIDRVLLRYEDGRILWAGARHEDRLPTPAAVEESASLALLSEGEELRPGGFRMEVTDARGGYGWTRAVHLNRRGLSHLE